MDSREKFPYAERNQCCSESTRQKADAIVLKILQLLENEKLNVYDAERILSAARHEVMHPIFELEHTTMLSVPESLKTTLWGVF